MITLKTEQLFAVQSVNNKPRQEYVLYHKHTQYERVYMMLLPTMTETTHVDQEVPS